MNTCTLYLSDRIDPSNYNKPISAERRALLDCVESVCTKVADHGESSTTTVVLRVPFGTTDRTILSICQQVGVETWARGTGSGHDCSGRWFGGAAEIERGVVRRSRFSDNLQTIIVRVWRSQDV